MRILQIYVQFKVSSGDVQNKYHNSTYSFYGIMPLCNVLYGNCRLHNFKTKNHIFMKFGSNIKHYETICREHER